MKVSFLRSVAVTAAALTLFALQPIVPAIMATTGSNDGVSEAAALNKSEIHFKLIDESDITLHGKEFVSPSGLDVTKLNTILDNKSSIKSPLFNESKDKIKERQQHLKAKSGRKLADLSTYYRIKLHSSADSSDLLAGLKELPYISEAYFAPRATPSPVSADYASMQKYHMSAPTGMGVNAVSSVAGIKGAAVKIADIEYAWNTNHEDLSDTRAAGALLANGTPVDPFPSDNANHGTAVAGITNGDVNGYGITGIVPNAPFRMINANNAERGWDVANAIYLAQSTLEPGDVVLLEQQAVGPNGSYAPVEWIPAVYDAITYATASGLIVIEAAGNGGQNLNDPVYGTRFPAGKADSGAIIVGAGAACGYQPNTSRMSFSNYGSRVNVQGWGECVTTSGYGSLAGTTVNNWYTSGFNGTSSASAVVAAAAAALSSAKETQTGVRMTSVDMRNLLVSTGTPQNTTVNPGNIGPLPNLEKALGMHTVPQTDTQAPTAPTNLTAKSSGYKVYLKWTASKDNVGVARYKVFRNGSLIGTSTTPYYTDITAKPGVKFTYKVYAVDAASNVSLGSNGVKIAARR